MGNDCRKSSRDRLPNADRVSNHLRLGGVGQILSSNISAR